MAQRSRTEDVHDGRTAPYQRVGVMQFHIRSIDEKNRIIEGFASTPDVDSYEEIVEPRAFADTLDQYLRNPIVSWDHNWWDPVGWTKEAEIQEGGLWVKIQIALADEIPKVRETWARVLHKLVRSMSIGFDGRYTPEFGHWNDQTDVWHWTKLILREIAIVSIPACPGATFDLAKRVGTKVQTRGKRTWQRGDGAELKVAPEGLPWNPDGVSDAMIAATNLRIWKHGAALAPDTDAAMGACLTWDGPGAEVDHYHDIFARREPLTNDGELLVFWPRVASLMARTMGARGGAALSADERRERYDALASLYQRCDRQPPEFDPERRYKDVQFYHDEPDLLEEEIALADVETLRRKATSIGNVARGWAKRDRVPSVHMARRFAASLRTMSEEGLDLLKRLPGQDNIDMRAALTDLVKATDVPGEDEMTRAFRKLAESGGVLDATPEGGVTITLADGKTVRVIGG